MRLTPDVLKIDAEKVSQQIEVFIREKIEELQREGIILGLSGGLDSAVGTYLCARSVGPDKILAIYMPDKDSNPKHGEDAKRVADELGIKFQVEDLTPALYYLGVYNSLPIKYVPSRTLRGLVIKFVKYTKEKIRKDSVTEYFVTTKNRLVARGAAYGATKHVMRLAVLFRYATLHNLSVVGTTNKNEYLRGIFVPWGCDGQADIMPIQGLFRTQIIQLAKYLGVPQRIIDKPGDTDVIPGIDDKEKIYGPFEMTDLILYGLEKGLSPEEMYDQFGQEKVDRIVAETKNARMMREPPYVPNLKL